MPFTLSHPAAVLPLLRHPFSPAALICGAVAPDVPYFLGAAGIPVSAQSWYEPFLNATTSHQMSGIGVPALFAAALLAVYAVVRRPVVALLPARSSPVGERRLGDPLRRAGWVLLSLAIGISTHLVWDAFTHADGYLVTHLAVLRSRVVGDLTVARALQHLSTATGLLAVVVAMWRRLRNAHARPGAATDTLPTLTRRVVAGGLTVAALLGAAVNAGPLTGRQEAGISAREAAETVVSDWLTGGGAALACAVLAYAGGWWVHKALLRVAAARRSALTE
ncbi:DUF4184 family protein [Streptomyces althioticus]|uniref:DUF4184 family protein n=1 Tax=Streptomyces althioticus TaxID=83380 RepID=UPI0036FB121B